MLAPFFTLLTLALSVMAFEPRQDLSDPAVASSVLTALSSDGPGSLSSLTSSLDAGFSTETGPINSITVVPLSTPVTSIPSSTAQSNPNSMGPLYGTTDSISSAYPTAVQSGAERLKVEGLAIAVVGFLIGAGLPL